MVREDILIPKLSIFFLSVVLSVVAVTYYQMYFHYWFVELKGGRIMRLGFLMLPLSFMTLQYFLMRRKRFTIRNDSLTKINIILVVYLLFSMLSILANEMDYNDARIYSAQIAYPVLLYFCILEVCKTIDYIKAAMRVIFFIALICGLYAMYYYITYDTGRIMEYYLSNDVTGLGELDIALSYGSSFPGADGIRVFRLTIPGISSPNFGSLLVLPIIIGLCFYKSSNGIRKWLYGTAIIFLFGCLVYTFSRGALISLFCGILYLIWKRAFDRKDVCVLILISVVVVGVLGFDRIYVTGKHVVTRFAKIDSVNPFSDTEDVRVKGLYDALMFWTECPVIGCGTTRFIERQLKIFNTSDHNYYSRLLASRGLVGLIPFVVFILLLQMTLSSNKWKVEQSLKPMEHALGAGMVALIINLNMFVPADLFHVWIWFALTGAWIRICSQYRKKGSIISSEAREGIDAVPA